MIRVVDLQTVVNQSPNVERINHTAQEGPDHNAQRFALQLSQERQAQRSRVVESKNPHAVWDKERREEKARKRRLNRKPGSAGEEKGKPGPDPDFCGTNLVDIRV